VVTTFAKVNEKIPSKLILVGDGPERGLVERLGRELKICNRIVFLGKVRDTAHVLEISDLFLLPSETESFGLAALEAMACEVPVISSNTGGIPEINIHGETGFLSNVGDVEDMAKNTIYLLEDEARLKTFKQKAFEKAQHFDLKYILPLYEGYYEKVIANIK
jgi:N-acetyl-alpha-D-glucosaminyl L-malate synthase BshA